MDLAKTLAVDDLNSDGRPDAVVLTDTHVQIFLNDGQADFLAPTNIAISNGQLTRLWPITEKESMPVSDGE